MIELDGISKRLSTEFQIEDLSLTFPAEGTTVVIGPSGCGKTTILKLLTGLIVPDSGKIRFDGEELNSVSMREIRKKTGYVIQSGGLFPHFTAFQNIAVTALAEDKPEVSVSERVKRLCEISHFSDSLLGNYPSQLSGGQAQRVGIMRALFNKPKYLLLDEPLGSLDPLIRAELQRELKEIFAELNTTVILVTHDLNEAAFFADSVVLMKNGAIVQKGMISELVNSPTDEFVNDFISAQRSVI